MMPEAIEHALHAKDYENAGNWVEQACDAAMQHGQLETMRNWLDALPENVVAENVGLSIWYGWVLALQGEFDELEVRLAVGENRARQVARTKSPHGREYWRCEAERALGKFAAIRTQAAVRQGHEKKALEWSKRALALLPKQMDRERTVVWLNRAQALEGLGRFDDAERGYEQAEETSRSTGHPFIQLGVLLARGRLMLRMGKVKEAEGLLTRARSVAGEMRVSGLEVLEQDVRREVERAKDRDRARPVLSAREREILRWLARGESNPQIAKRLEIGVGTVNWHTKNIYKKMGARNRTEAALLSKAVLG
jgi:ATP/maltotriose-dependent transcriptional regulator MalT